MKFKKIFLPFIAGALALSLAACGEKDKAATDETPQEETEQGATKEEEASAKEMQEKLAEQQLDRDEIVAVVNEEELTGEKYNVALTSIQSQMQQMGQDPSSDEAAEQIKAQALDTLVNQTLILQQAKEEEIKASEAEIDEEYASYEKQVGGEEEMKQALESQSMDVKTFKERIAEFIILEKYQDKAAPVGEVTEQDIKEYYDLAAAQSKAAGQEFPPLEEASEDIQAMIEREKQQTLLAAHVEELKEDAEIELKI